LFRCTQTIKVYPCGSWQDSGSAWPDLFFVWHLIIICK
jgi:hypothetical protein